MVNETRIWRKELKKQQRKRRRQIAAKARDKILDDTEAAKLQNPVYCELMQQEATRAELQRLFDERQHQDEDEAWQRRELRAQRQFQIERKRSEAEEDEHAQKQKEQEEAEAATLRQAEERKRIAEKATADFEQLMQRMQEYLDDASITQPPAELRRIVETRPGAKACEFYERTNCCRYGTPCIFSHRRPMLSKIIVIRHFFSHPLLVEREHGEYRGADAKLEFSEHDLCQDYDAFFEDVVPELETFGTLVNFRTVRNVLPHLRGHVFVEYTNERSALKAFTKLQGRFYATKRLNVEFSNLTSWRGAVCGT